MTSRKEARLSAFTPREETAVTVRREGEPPSLSVTEAVARVNRAIASAPDLSDIWIRGEISGFKRAASGHWYFDLKDDGAVLNAAMFRGANGRVRFDPEDGMEVLVRGRLGVYANRSNLQVVVEEIRPLGQGELAVRFEQLKRKLAEEGLFDAARKRPLPEHPRRVGIVTSLNAAALRDMVRVATQRHPGIQLVVANARVQGEGAAQEIAAGIALLDRHGACDVIIVGRGGGSLEDLWAFNEEAVVRAVAASGTPVVSAVGHETDFTLCDLAADRRAATPSNACEIVVPDAEALLDQLDDYDNRMWGVLERLVPDMEQALDELEARAEDGIRRTLEKEREMLGLHVARLESLSPLGVLARGYAVVRKDGRALRSVASAHEGDEVEIIFPDGKADATVTRTRREAP